MSKFFFFISLPFAILLFPLSATASQKEIGGILLSAGVNHTFGFYSEYYTDGWSFSLGTIVQVPALYDYLFAETGILFEHHSLKENENSYLRAYSLRAGMGVFLPLWRYCVPYIGIDAQESYIQFHADIIDKNEYSFKPGSVLKAGFFLPLQSYITLRVGMDYSFTEISDKWFQSASVNVSGIIRYPWDAWSIGKAKSSSSGFAIQANADSMYKKALENAATGETEKAEFSLKRVLDINPDHRDARAMLKKILFAKENYQKAYELIKERRYFDAITSLEKSIPYVKSAAAELNTTRAKLFGEIPSLERLGIEAYEKKDYARCIIILNRLKTIEPNNETAAMYLPRAIRRKEAIDRLK